MYILIFTQRYKKYDKKMSMYNINVKTYSFLFAYDDYPKYIILRT